MFSVIARSMIAAGSGTIIITTTSTTAPAAIRSVCFINFCMDEAIGLRNLSAGDAIDKSQQLRDRLVELLRDLLPDLHRGVQRARQRRVGDHGDFVLLRDLADLRGEQ